MLQQVKLLFSIFFIFSISFLYAKGQFQFEKETHDFGIVIDGVKATYIFKFKNVGDQPIIMNQVKPSCGCTSPVWTKTPILPGQEGEIKVIYNSTNRIGSFNKSITISSNADPASKVVYIKGLVIRASEKEYSTAELQDSPKLLLAKNKHFFGKIEVNKPVVYTFIIKNMGKNPLEITKVEAGCHCIHYELSKQEIVKGESAKLTVTYRPRVEGKNMEDVIIIRSNDLKDPYQSISLTADVVKSLTTNNMLFQNQGKGF